MGNTVTAQLVSHDLPRLTTVISQHALEESPGRCAISFILDIDINHLAILIHSSPKLVALDIDLYEDFIDVEGIAVTSMSSLKPFGVDSSEPT